jgi:hypothetical protein
MQQTETQHTNFTAGEVSPKMAARIDVARKGNSCVELENFLIDSLGGAFKAPGTKFVAEIKTPTLAARLVPFIYSDEQAYVLEFGNLYIRFFKDRGQIVNPGTAVPYEIVSPYSTSDLPNISWCQSANVMYLMHPLHAPYKLSRTSHTDWHLDPVTFNDGPYLPLNTDTTCYLTPSATWGTITLTATAGKTVFAAGHVGAIFRLRHAGASDQ